MTARPVPILVLAAVSILAVRPAAGGTGSDSTSWVITDVAVPTVTPVELAALPRVDPAGWADQAAPAAQQPAPAPMPRAVAYEYSDGYRTRAKIHRYASFATLPLFVSQFLVGDKLYDGTGGGGAKSAHSALAFGIGTLFGVNSVTGVWNLWEARHDPVHRKRRLLHGIVMLGCDAGFVATGLLAPDDDHGFDPDRRSLHRKVAITSMGIAGANFLFMLLTNR